MKIVRLRALNINSLSGETDIDFTTLLQDNALFAITGPTGAGKSTLLDIISCALYAQTARLKNPNDLVSRYSGEALCEVEFEIKGETYRSSWRQRKARKKYDGNFQSAKMELAIVRTGKIVASGTRDVPKEIEQLSGLDFDRFTQSMMLAQGSFDAFLKAKESDRSELLEKITGTKIYADISQKVYENYSRGKQTIEIEEHSLASVEFVDENELKEREKNLIIYRATKKQKDTDQKLIRDALSWRKELKQLEGDSKRFGESFTAISLKKEANRGKFIKLDLATKALRVAPLSTQKIELENRLNDDKKSALSLNDEIAKVDDDIKQNDREYQRIEKEYLQAKIDFDSAVEKLKSARSIETQEQETSKALVKLNSAITEKQKREKKLKEELETLIKSSLKQEKEISKHRGYLQKNAKDEQLLADMSLIEEKVEQLQEDISHRDILHIEYQKDSISFRENQDAYKKQKELVDKLKSKNKKYQTDYKVIEKEVAEDTKQEPSLQQRVKELENLAREYDSYHKLEKEKIETYNSIENNNKILNSTASVITTLEELIESLEIQKEKDVLIQKYEDDRAKLIDGQACWLCGSLEHPFSQDLNTLSVDRLTHKIKEKKLELHKSRTVSITAQTKVDTDNKHIESLTNQQQPIVELFAKNSLDISIHHHFMEEVKRLQGVLDSITKRRESREESLKQRDEIYRQLQSEEKRLNDINSLSKELENQLKQTDKLRMEKIERIDKTTQALIDQYRAYGLTFEIKSYQEQFLELRKRKESFVTIKRELESLEDNEQKILLDKSRYVTQIEALNSEIAIESKNLSETTAHLTLLETERISLLNVADLNEYELEINKHFDTIHSKEKSAKQKLQNLNTTAKEKKSQTKKLEEKISKDRERLSNVIVEFEIELERQGFETLESFRDASLSKEIFEELSSVCKHIDEEYNSIKTLKDETNSKLTKHQKEPLSDKSIEVLNVELEESDKEIDALQLTIGRDETELKLHQKNFNEHKEKIASLATKKEAFKVWEKMQELIGSADGAKFAKFAQGITLDQLIYLANQHLKILSKRYILIRSRQEKHLLELEIIDTYQGNLIRPVATLSGGESFIVSLALALGLSELASQKISIDSLFMDEGFGTLDDESLEVALNALNLLQSSGKMVGVISHVEALKEAIPLQIKIVPNGDGTSRVMV